MCMIKILVAHIIAMYNKNVKCVRADALVHNVSLVQLHNHLYEYVAIRWVLITAL